MINENHWKHHTSVVCNCSQLVKWTIKSNAQFRVFALPTLLVSSPAVSHFEHEKNVISVPISRILLVVECSYALEGILLSILHGMGEPHSLQFTQCQRVLDKIRRKTLEEIFIESLWTCFVANNKAILIS